MLVMHAISASFHRECLRTRVKPRADIPTLRIPETGAEHGEEAQLGALLGRPTATASRSGEYLLNKR